MQKWFLALTCVLAASFGFLVVSARPTFSRLQQAEQQTAPQRTAEQASPSQAAPEPQPVPSGPVIVLDPAHGGTDSGARGENGLTEKDVVLQIARTVREQLAQKGYRVVLTRNDDSNPSYDDRAGTANGYREAIFISLHVSSTGTPGTVHAYFDQFSTPIPAQPVPAAVPGTKQGTPRPQSTLVVWHEAQRPYVDVSHRLADLIQLQLAQSFSGSPTASAAAAIRTLRSVTAPAVAIEVSSVASPADALSGSGAPLAAAIANAISALRQGVR